MNRKSSIINYQLVSALILLFFCFSISSCNGQDGEKETEVLLETTAGDIRIRLFNDTPIHRDNFINNVRAGKYDGVSFHRVIRNFMVQTGDPNTRAGHEAELAAAEADTTASLGDTITAEILFPKYYHKRGMVAAAREGDDVNPTKASNAYQFYIVTGRFQNEEMMLGYDKRRVQAAIDALYQQKIQAHADELEVMRKARDTNGVSNLLERLLDEARLEVEDNPPVAYNNEQLRAYRTYGGAPWLDGDYTVFGEVVEGMKVVLDIEKVKTGAGDKPLRDIRITRATVL